VLFSHWHGILIRAWSLSSASQQHVILNNLSPSASSYSMRRIRIGACPHPAHASGFFPLSVRAIGGDSLTTPPHAGHTSCRTLPCISTVEPAAGERVVVHTVGLRRQLLVVLR
jgi:hypothetical protein